MTSQSWKSDRVATKGQMVLRNAGPGGRGVPRRPLVIAASALRQVQAADAALGAFGDGRQKEAAFADLQAAARQLRRAAGYLYREVEQCAEAADWDAVGDLTAEPGDVRVTLTLPADLALAFEDSFWQARDCGWAICRRSWHVRLFEWVLGALGKGERS